MSLGMWPTRTPLTDCDVYIQYCVGNIRLSADLIDTISFLGRVFIFLLWNSNNSLSQTGPRRLRGPHPVTLNYTHYTVEFISQVNFQAHLQYYYNYLRRHLLSLKSRFKINKLEKLLKLVLKEILLICLERFLQIPAKRNLITPLYT